ncbi:MAG: hypothetical protein QGF46_02155 [Planctomycetota bacterium]|nr:hypothetical protein [Planctomycetota bacterium]
MSPDQLPPCPNCGCRPHGYLELFETVENARCQHCQESINVRGMAQALDAFSDREIVAEGEANSSLLDEDDPDN